jgi:hypothetical protein
MHCGVSEPGGEKGIEAATRRFVFSIVSAERVLRADAVVSGDLVSLRYFWLYGDSFKLSVRTC